VPLVIVSGVVISGSATCSFWMVNAPAVNEMVLPPKSMVSAPGQLALLAALIAAVRFAGVVIAAEMNPAQVLAADAGLAKANPIRNSEARHFVGEQVVKLCFSMTISHSRLIG
jgi:hypothetical protein